MRTGMKLVLVLLVATLMVIGLRSYFAHYDQSKLAREILAGMYNTRVEIDKPQASNSPERGYMVKGRARNLGTASWPEGHDAVLVGLTVFRQSVWDRILGRPGNRHWASVYIPLKVIKPGGVWEFNIAVYTDHSRNRIQLELRDEGLDRHTCETRVYPFGNIVEVPLPPRE